MALMFNATIATTRSMFSETTATSMGVRVLIAAAFYAGVILKSVVPATRKTLQSFPSRWAKMHARPGQALTSTAEETVLAFALAVHHITGGTLMLMGTLMQVPELWVTGLCIEIGFEIVDVIALMLNAWPYPLVQPGLRFLTLAHHVPGLLVSPGLVLIGQLHLNSDLQAIGWALLLAGGVSLLTDGLKQTRDLDSELGQWLGLHILNLIGVVLCRFIIFPQASYRLLTLVNESHPSWLFALSSVGVGAMSLFNVVVFVILTEKLVRHGATFISRKFSAQGKRSVGSKQD